ncbi:MAG: stage V sporulation protein AA [Alicyclobacillaceae bacterium]|nr:stage V sporulation protein AA [Alicyclobacillaceae bacterium]
MENLRGIEVYVRPKERMSYRTGVPLRVGEVAEVVAIGPRGAEVGEDIRRIPVAEWSGQKGDLRVVQAIDILVAIKRRWPGVNVHLIGPTETIVDLDRPDEQPAPWYKVAAVWLLLFVGSGLTIMNFHADVSMVRVHQRIYQLITGHFQERPLMLQIPYAFGVGIGMALFFNHLLRRKFNEHEPSPLEVEVFQYEQMINQYVITREGSKQEGRGPHDP